MADGSKWYRHTNWARLIALAVLAGLILAVLTGVSALLFVFVWDQNPLFPCRFDRFSCQALLSRLLLPFPDPNLCNLARNAVSRSFE